MTTQPKSAADPCRPVDLTPSTDEAPANRPPPNRRQVLLAAGLGAGSLTIAACGSSSTPAAASSTPASASAPAAVLPSAAGSSVVSSAAPAPVSSAAAPATSAPAPATSAAAPPPAATPSSSSATPSSSSAKPSSSSAPAAKALIALSKVPVGGAAAASDANGNPIIVAQPTAGKAVAFSAICTHQGCTVAVVGVKLDCPCHGSKFNALTGAVLNGPATAPLPAVAVKVQGGSVVAG